MRLIICLSIMLLLLRIIEKIPFIWCLVGYSTTKTVVLAHVGANNGHYTRVAAAAVVGAYNPQTVYNNKGHQVLEPPLMTPLNWCPPPISRRNDSQHVIHPHTYSHAFLPFFSVLPSFFISSKIPSTCKLKPKLFFHRKTSLYTRSLNLLHTHTHTHCPHLKLN